MTRRAVAELRAEIERTSTAPQFLTITAFAEAAGVSVQQFGRWMRSGAVWVPRPAVVLGENGRAGWELEAVKGWRPGAPAVERPEPRTYLNTTEMCARWHLTPALLWLGITEHSEPQPPDMWLVHGLRRTPGWLPR